MKVIEHQPGLWFLLSKEEHFYFDVYCNHSAMGFSRTIPLNKMEIEEYKLKGRIYLSELADDVQYFALSKYLARQLPQEISNRTDQAIIEFNKSQG